MRGVRNLVALLIASALVISGCLQVPEAGEEDPGGDGGTSSDSGTNTDRETSTEGEDPPDGNESDEGDEGSGNETDEGDGNQTDPDPSCTAEPAEQQVDDEDDIECAGHYAITEPGTGSAWDAPQWNEGDWWVYEIKAVAGGTRCIQEREEVEDTGQTLFDEALYTMGAQRHDCDKEPPENDTTIRQRTQSSLMRIYNDGYIEHNAVFPFHEGMQWVTMDQNGNLRQAEIVGHESTYPHDAALVEAWHLEIDWQEGENEFHSEITWGVEARNVLKETHTIGWSGGTIIIEKKLVDSSTSQDGGLLLQLP